MGMDSSALRSLAASQRIAAARVRSLTRKVVMKTGNDIARDAKTIAHQKFSSEATGATANSITSKMVGELCAEVGPTTYYAPFVELGTSRMAAKPFMAPAAERHRDAFAQAIELIGEEGTGA